MNKTNDFFLLLNKINETQKQNLQQNNKTQNIISTSILKPTKPKSQIYRDLLLIYQQIKNLRKIIENQKQKQFLLKKQISLKIQKENKKEININKQIFDEIKGIGERITTISQNLSLSKKKENLNSKDSFIFYSNIISWISEKAHQMTKEFEELRSFNHKKIDFIEKTLDWKNDFRFKSKQDEFSDPNSIIKSFQNEKTQTKLKNEQVLNEIKEEFENQENDNFSNLNLNSMNLNEEKPKNKFQELFEKSKNENENENQNQNEIQFDNDFEKEKKDLFFEKENQKINLEKNDPNYFNEWKMIEEELDENESKKLMQENLIVKQKLMDTVDQVKEIEVKLIEISKLQDLFANKIIEQSQEIDYIYDSTVSATEHLKLAKEELLITRNRKFSCFRLVFVLLMIASFSLLFLNWLS
ncbi:syntaxin-18 [Anaeramoeba ignava]|uniref:Syntaxin-18 n=1 Tax=Anaeramoeba ignava TaxID=1746090 RepID=A0A9Q0LDR3_ANAIG|nr:syntaxin-18 [Anaeramoeba ignava]